MARRVTREFPTIEAIYTSPLRRALQTARMIAALLDQEARVVEGLKEIHFGQLEGVSLGEMKARYPELHARWQDRSDMRFQWPGGEERAQFFRRAAAACRKICEAHPPGSDRSGSHSGRSIAVVAHGGTIRACLAHLLPEILGEWWTYALDNTGITRVRLTEEGARLLALNDASHLEEEPTEPNAV